MLCPNLNRLRAVSCKQCSLSCKPTGVHFPFYALFPANPSLDCSSDTFFATELLLAHLNQSLQNPSNTYSAMVDALNSAYRSANAGTLRNPFKRPLQSMLARLHARNQAGTPSVHASGADSAREERPWVPAGDEDWEGGVSDHDEGEEEDEDRNIAGSSSRNDPPSPNGKAGSEKNGNPVVGLNDFIRIPGFCNALKTCRPVSGRVAKIISQSHFCNGDLNVPRATPKQRPAGIPLSFSSRYDTYCSTYTVRTGTWYVVQ